MLQSHHEREDVFITDVGPFSGTGLINAGFQSDIKKATVKYRVRQLDRFSGLLVPWFWLSLD